MRSVYHAVVQAKGTASSNDAATLKLFVDGEEVVHFPVSVHGNELLQMEASFPAGELMLHRFLYVILSYRNCTVFSAFCVQLLLIILMCLMQYITLSENRVLLVSIAYEL